MPRQEVPNRSDTDKPGEEWAGVGQGIRLVDLLDHSRIYDAALPDRHGAAGPLLTWWLVALLVLG
jgi:hypothetical protein